MTINKEIDLPNKPDNKISVADVFNIDSKLTVKGFAKKTAWVPEIDSSYVFDKETTLSILAGFEHNRRVMIQGFHGTGKSTHIEQIAARLNWPCVRLLDQNKIINPHSSFRLFATTNTVGLGDMTGLYHGTQQINQGQMDRWHILSTLNYLDPSQELKVVMSKLNNLKGEKNKEIIKNMIKLANLTRVGFANGDISTLMSPRTVISWGQNFKIFKDLVTSFNLTFLNKCDDIEKSIISEYFQRCFDIEIDNGESGSAS